MEPVPFDQVVTDHGAAVLRVCRAMLGPDDAADAWSETFLSAMRAYPDLEPGSNVRAWLLTIARRRSVDQLREKGRAPTPAGELPEPGPASPEVGVAHTDAELMAVVAALPPRQRAAVAYRYLADLSYDEIGRVIGSNGTAARRSAADGIAALRAAYRPGVDR
jgi:RNA polymerase sigma factor (sigma-70 family)